MQKLTMCRICLVQNVRMHEVTNKNLQEIYEKLTDIPLLTEDRRPMLACFFCFNRLKQCLQLQQKCLQAEKLFAQILNEDFEAKPILDQGFFEFSGYIISPIVHNNVTDKYQRESHVIKEELPDNCEGQDDENEIELKHEFRYIKNLFLLTHHSKSEEINQQHLKSENVPIRYSESDSEDDVLLMKLKTEVEEEQEVSKAKRKATDIKRATAATKPKKDIRRTKLEDTSAAQQRLCIQEKSYRCEICLQSYTQKNHLTQHTCVHTGEKPYKCDTCQRGFIKMSDLTNHIRVHTGEKPFKCGLCQRGFIKMSDLTNHIRVHNGDKPYKCKICPLSFVKNCDFKRHTRVHTGEKPYKCEICQRSFATKTDLTKHIRVHNGDKPYTCDICKRRFTEKGTLTTHIRVHTGEKPYKCEICQSSFTQKTSLTNHNRVHTGEKPYKCEICQRNFTDKSNLRKHKNRVHTGKTL